MDGFHHGPQDAPKNAKLLTKRPSEQFPHRKGFILCHQLRGTALADTITVGVAAPSAKENELSTLFAQMVQSTSGAERAEFAQQLGGLASPSSALVQLAHEWRHRNEWPAVLREFNAREARAAKAKREAVTARAKLTWNDVRAQDPNFGSFEMTESARSIYARTIATLDSESSRENVEAQVRNFVSRFARLPQSLEYRDELASLMDTVAAAAGIDEDAMLALVSKAYSDAL